MLKWDLSNALNKILYFKNQLIHLKEKKLWMKGDSEFFHLILDPIVTLEVVELVRISSLENNFFLLV